MKNLLARIVLGMGIVGLAQPSAAKIVKFEILRRESPAFEGRTFGDIGTYDRIVARATIGVAPGDPHNSIIVDIDNAPRNEQGLVEAVSDVEILRPTIAANGNKTLFYEVLNRGNKLAYDILEDLGVSNDLAKAADAGNGFLMNQGYTVVWSGWQGDIAPGARARWSSLLYWLAPPAWRRTGGLMTFSPPVVPHVNGNAREEFVFDHTDNPVTVKLSYPAADLDPAHANLTVREREDDARTKPEGLSFVYVDANQIAITRPAGFDAGAIYEFMYIAKDPKVMGLGFAATRDIVSFLRHGVAERGSANVLAGQIEHTIGFGLSQSGRFVRDFLYLGFNTDEVGRPVFDGLMPYIAGGKKTFTNYRFSQPGRNVLQHEDTLYPGGEFPFSYPVIADAITGRSDGLLARCLVTSNCPKIMQIDSELEFYQSRASLVATDTQGHSLAMPDNVRLYLLSNLQHFAVANAKSVHNKICAFPTNPLNAGPPLRALVVAMNSWISSGTLPPASRYPSRADDTLVPPTDEADAFPHIPSVSYTGLVTTPAEINFNTMPPIKGTTYPVFIPKTDADGRDIAGLRLPTLEAPVATYTGWNLRKAGFAEGELCDLNGSMFPFAATRDVRLQTNDTRLSVAERYPDVGARAAAIARAAHQLVKDRLLLEEDVKLFTAGSS